MPSIGNRTDTAREVLAGVNQLDTLSEEADRVGAVRRGGLRIALVAGKRRDIRLHQMIHCSQ